MKNCFLTFIIAIIFAGNCIAQTYIEPFAGFQIDIANKAKFQQINTGVQVSFKSSKRYEFIIRLQKSTGLSYRGNDSSFTTNASLPLYSNAPKTIHPNAWYISADHRFILNGDNKKSLFSILLLTSIAVQNIKVKYQYDKENYTVLNPDQTQETTTLFVGVGLEYMRFIKNNRIFVQLSIDGPLTSLSIKYPSSFSYTAPLAINVGYSFLIKKNKHEK